MGVPQHMVGIKGDMCACGRRATVRHCIECGSARVYARQNRLHTFKSGEQKFVEIEFRCQACGHTFTEEEREFCNAPPITIALAKLKVQRLYEASKENEFLDPSVMAKAVELAGQKPNEVIQEMKDHNEGMVVDWTPRSDEEVAALVENEKALDTRKDMSVPERLARREWADAVAMGQRYRLPTADEFVKRRLSGETMENILT